jgi:uncharacterized phage-like protein YoqJ
MKISGTGHRPDKLVGGWDNYDTNLTNLVELLRYTLRFLNASEVHSGMAVGFDTALAEAALFENVKLHCQIPFKTFDSRWNWKQREKYYQILDKAEYVNFVTDDEISEKGHAAFWNQKRNEILVDNCDALVVLWNGSSGGTNNCLKYASDKRKYIVNLWDLYFTKASQELKSD